MQLIMSTCWAVRDVQFIRDPVGLVNASLTANSDDVVFGSVVFRVYF